MIDNVLDINDLKRLYQLYIMTDKILSIQLKSKSGINYELLKKFKNISIHINDVSMHDATLKMKDLDEDTKDYYSEQDKMSKIVKVMEDIVSIRNMLISNYRNYSVLPLMLVDTINLNDFDYYRDRLNNINDYIQNDIYLTKLNESLSELGINLGNKTSEEEKLLEMIPIFEKKLKSIILNSDRIKRNLQSFGFDVEELLDNNILSSKYKEILGNYNDSLEKYDAMKLVDDSEYLDIVKNITNEYNKAKINMNVIEVINLVFNEVNDYDSFQEKRMLLKTNLLNIKEDVFGRDFEELLSYQLDNMNNVKLLRKEILDIKEQIHKNNSLIARINREQKQIKKQLDRKKETIQISDNQVVKINDSYLTYSKEKVKNVLKFVFDKLQSEVKKREEDNIFEDMTDTKGLFADSISNSLKDEKELGFEKISDVNDIFAESNEDITIPNFDQSIGKIESYDDIFDNRVNNNIEAFTIDNDILNSQISSEIPNSKIQYLDANNNFWPNIG